MLNRLFSILRTEVGDGYPVATNISYNWAWGSLSGIFLIIQIITGILLSMHYQANINFAFDSVEHIMTNVHYGYVLRYMHANGASFYFFSMYMHMGKNLYFKLYLNNKFAWFSGLTIFLLSMATAFIGYVLPWGQMSYWGATVITNIFSAIPTIGSDLVIWLWGGYSVDGPTLSRFYSLHFTLPFIILVLVFVHIFFLHNGNSSNRLMIKSNDKSPFYPYMILKDFVIFFFIIFLYFYFVFFNPNYLGHSDNYIRANPLVTPLHIVPEWYFLPFYAILRAVPDKLGGAVLMLFSILVLFFLPIFDCINNERNSQFAKNKYYDTYFFIFSCSVITLGWLGSQPIENPFINIGIFVTFLYFSFFLYVFLPFFLSIFLKIFKFKKN